MGGGRLRDSNPLPPFYFLRCGKKKNVFFILLFFKNVGDIFFSHIRSLSVSKKNLSISKKKKKKEFIKTIPLVPQGKKTFLQHCRGVYDTKRRRGYDSCSIP